MKKPPTTKTQQVFIERNPEEDSTKLSTIANRLKESNSELEMVNENFSYLIDKLKEWRKQDELDALERQRERGGSPSSPSREKDQEEDSSGGLIAALLAGGLIAGLIGAIPGAIAGFVAGLGEFVGGFFTKLKESINKKWESFKTSINDFFENMKKKFESLKTKLRQNKFLASVENAIIKVGKFFGEIFVKISEGLKWLGEATGITKFFKDIKGSFLKFFGFFKVLGRLFLPITVIVDGIMRSFEEFGKLDEDATIGDKLGALGKVITKTFLGIFTGLGDLIKSFTSWILEKAFGEDNAVSKFLDNFSFTELMEKLVDMVFKGWDLIVNADWGKMLDDGIQAVSAQLSELWSSVKATFFEIADELEMLVKNFVSAILPAKDAFKFTIPALSVMGKTIMDEKQVDLNPIPSSLYEWAGEGSKEKVRVSASSSMSIQPQRAQTLEVMSQNEMRQAQQTMNAAGINASTNNSNNSNVTVNQNSQQPFYMPGSRTNTRARGAYS